MRSPADSLSCSQAPRKRLLLVGGITVPAIVLGSLLGTAPAFADASPTSITSKSDLTSAFGTAGTADSTVQLTSNLTAASDDDIQSLTAGKSLTVDLHGKVLDLDQLRVAAGASLSIIDSVGTGSLVLGPTVLSTGDATGIRLAAGAHFTAKQNAHVTAVGSAGLPGVGTASGTATGTQITVSGGAVLTATGGSGAAGVGGTAPATIAVDHATVTATGGSSAAAIGGAASSTITVANSIVTATGGSGAAGIGGSTATSGSSVTLTSATVTAKEGATVSGSTAPASAIGAGQDATDIGSLSIDSASTLNVPTGAHLRVASGATVDNEGTIQVAGSISGDGVLANGGAIQPVSSTNVDAALQITGNDYDVALAPGTGSVTPTHIRVLADSFDHGTVALPSATPDSTHTFTNWTDGSRTVASSTSLGTSVANGAVLADNKAKPVALTAVYDQNLSVPADGSLGYLDTSTTISQQLPSSGTGPITWGTTPTAGTIPAGLTLSSTGLLSGQPTSAGDFSFTVLVSGPHNSVPKTYTGSVGVIPVMAATTLTNATVGTAYSATIAATSGTAGITYTTADTLPAGLTLAANGTLSGTPTAGTNGPISFTVLATNHWGHDSAVVTLTAHSIPVFTTATLDPAVLGTNYRYQLQSNGDGSITYALAPSSTALPGTMTVSSSGLISGIATRSGSRTITVVATSIYGSTSQDFVFVAGDVPAITTTTLPDATTGAAGYSVQLTSSGNGDITWTSSNLPAGLHLSAGGLLTGPITVAGPSTFTVTSTSSFGTVEKDLTITAGDKPSITTSSLADADTEHAYSATVAASGTVAATFSSSDLPAGLSINGITGVISGTPTTAGSVTAHITATSVWGSDTEPFTITVHTKPVWASSATLDSVTTGAQVHQQLSAPADTVSTTTFASADLPSTLNLTSGGLLTGTVNATKTFTVVATNTYGSTSRTFTLTAGDAPVITTSSLTAPTLNDSTYSVTLHASGDGDKTFTAVDPTTLPAGLTLSSGGVLSGTPSTPGLYIFQVHVHTTWGDDTKSYGVVVAAAPSITTTSLLNPTFGVAYDQPVVAVTNVTSGATYSTPDTLPHGLSLSGTTGHITGTLASDAVAATFTVNIDTAYGNAHRTYTLTPGTAAHITTASADLGTPVAGRSFTGSIAGSGTGVTYAVTTGSLPDGLTLHDDGSITGTPTGTGTSHFIVTATSAYGSDTATYDLTVGAAPSFTTDSLGQAIVGMPFLKSLVTAGDGTIALHVQGALPAGITFDAATGTLAGTPTAAGTSTVTIVAVSDLATTPHDYTFTAFAAPALATTALSSGTAGSAYSTFVRATGSGDVTYAVSSGSLPAGLALNARTGALTGTPTAAGTATFTVTATSAYGSDSKPLTLTVDAAPVVTPPVTTPPASSAPVTTPPVVAAPSLPVAPKAKAELGHGFALSVAADSTVPVTYSVTGALPKGVALNAKTGLISGTAKESGSFTFTVKAVTSAGSDSQKYTVVVPEIVNLVQGSANWITPVQGQPMDVSIAGLQKGERWTVKANGKTVKTGTAVKAGTVTTSITLKKSLGDKRYVIAVSGSRTVTDPAKTASDEFTVTAITGRKALKVQRTGSLVKVVNFAPREIVALQIDGKTVATGRADEKGLFVHTVKAWSKGTHKVVATGKTTTRTGTLSVKITK